MSHAGYEAVRDDDAESTKSIPFINPEAHPQDGAGTAVNSNGEAGGDGGAAAGGANAGQAGAGADPKKATVKIEINASSVISGFYVFFLILCGLGLALLWCESDYLKSNISGMEVRLFLNVVIAVVAFALSHIPNYFIPSSHQRPIRVFGLFLFANNIDACLCFTHAIIKFTPWWGPPSDDDETIIHTGRAGAVFVLLGAVPAFLLTFAIPSTGRPFRETAKSAASIKGATCIVTAFFIFLGQCIMWGISADLCGLPTYGSNITPLLLSVLLITSTLFDDQNIQDVIFFYMIHLFFAAVPIFSAAPAGAASNFGDVYRASMAFIYIGTLIYFLGLFVARVKAFIGLRSVGQYPSAAENLKKGSTMGQIVFLLLSVAAAIMIWSWSVHWVDANADSRNSNYIAAFAVFVPLLNLVGSVAGFTYAHILALLFTFNIVPQLAYLLLGFGTIGFKVGSYYRGGVVIQLMCLLLSSTAALVSIPKKSVDQLFAASPDGDYDGLDTPDHRPRGAKPAGPSSISPVTSFVVWCLATAYCATENLTAQVQTIFGFTLYPIVGLIALLTFFAAKNPDVQRLVVLMVLFLVTNANIWPLTATPSFSKVFVVLNGLILVTSNLWENPLATLESLHAQVQGAEVTFSVQVVTDNQDDAAPGVEASPDQPLLSGHKRTDSIASNGGTFENVA